MRTLFLGVSLLAGAASAHASAIRYTVTDLNPGPVATALAINSSGHVVGYYLPTGSFGGGTHGFLYKDGAVTDIPTSEAASARRPESMTATSSWVGQTIRRRESRRHLRLSTAR